MAQRVLLRVSRFGYQPDRGRFRGWLKAVTRTEICAWHRRESRHTTRTGVETIIELVPTSDLGWNWERIYEARILEVALERIRPTTSELRWAAFLAIAFEQDEVGGSTTYRWVDRTEPGRAERVARQFGRPVGWVYKLKCELGRKVERECLKIAENLMDWD